MTTEKKNFRWLLPGILLLVVVSLVTIRFVVRNQQLKKEFKKIQIAPYIWEASELAQLASQNHPSAQIVCNSEQGRWDIDSGPKLEVRCDLVIGDESDEHKTFNRPAPVIADTEGNIYVGESLDSRTIKKFDPTGKYVLTIGRKGKGPGEFLGTFHFLFDHKGILHVLDYGTRRISQFSCNGKYLNSIQLSKDINNFTGFIIDSLGYYYISYYSYKIQKVIHKFSPTGEYLTSFGAPVHYKAPVPFMFETIIEGVSRGWLTINRAHEILYTRSNPYEIRKYTVAGTLKLDIFRKNTFMPPADVVIAGKMDHIYRMWATSTLIGIWENKIINCVEVPGYDKLPKTIIDLFDLKGQLLTSVVLMQPICFTDIDHHGKIYGFSRGTTEKVPQIVRYTLKLTSDSERR